MKMWKAENSLDPYHDWGTDQVVGYPDKEQKVIQDLQFYNVNRLYASYNKTAAQITSWNQKLYDAQIESLITIGDSSYDAGIFPDQRNLIINAINDKLLNFNNNSAQTVAERFAGVRLNLEPQRMDEWDNGTAADRRELLGHLLDTYTAVRTHLDANSGASLKIYADIGHYFDKLPAPDPANGKVGWTSEEDRDQWYADISQVLDVVIIMAYGLNLDSIERTTTYERGVLTASELALNVKDVISIGTGEDIWQNLEEFNQALVHVETVFFALTAIHSYRYLEHLSPPRLNQISPISSPTNTPRYTFSSSEEGIIHYSGPCGEGDLLNAVADTIDTNTVTFNLADGAYSGCTIKVEDSDSNFSDQLVIPNFTVINAFRPMPLLLFLPGILSEIE